ncbi:MULTISPECIES: hypothetical protein [unclassified Colwellia]|uniref:hypothetical protein n=1 Tax=unclassified Colwellia TaxID=196834 RepID=UPI0015F4F4E4|nr:MULTISPECIES: hypothetical protein [unclassified Colwellia]MBA6254429.1 hypothetical protein [Colwellia sp. MB3u-28]MBA6258491.1 hypothetical protein [Colwellia sp. MB3u-41]
MKSFLFLLMLTFSNLSYSKNSCPILDMMHQNDDQIGFSTISLGMTVKSNTHLKFDSPSKSGEHCGTHTATYTKESFPILLVLDHEFKVIDIHVDTSKMACDKDSLVTKAKSTFKNITFKQSRFNNLTELETSNPVYLIGEPILGVLMLKPSSFVAIGKAQCFE